MTIILLSKTKEIVNYLEDINRDLNIADNNVDD